MTKQFFTEDNTEGFTTKELAIMNAAREILVEQDDFAGMADYSLNDMITNAWTGQTNAAQIADDVHRNWMAK